MTTSLHIATNLSLPLDTVTQALGILAKRRAGKSYTARRIVEQLYAAKQQIVIVDPKGDWWGVRSSADGKSPGLAIPILGGEHGDIRLEVGAGEIVAKMAVEEAVSLLLDLSEFRKHEVATFMTAFLETLYRLKAREEYRTAMMLMIDEADAIAPQKPQHGEERMLGAAEDIVRRGGQRGIGCTLVTQRSAVLNKNVLTQIQMLVAMRTIAPQDLEAAKAWIDVHGTADQRKILMESLPSLPTGDAWFWSPGWPSEDGIFKRVHVLPIETFDSGATPRPGERKINAKTLADVDLKAFKERMSATIERAKADDPRELRAEIARLKKQIGDAGRAAPDPAAIQKAVAAALDKQSSEIAAKLRGMPGIITGITAHLACIDDVRQRLASLVAEAADSLSVSHPERRLPESKDLARSAARPVSTTLRNVTQLRGTARGTALGKGERRVLTAIAQYEDGVERDQLTVLTGYKRSSRDTYLARLFAAGYIAGRGSGLILASDAGIAALGADFEPLPTGAALREYWLARLTGGEKAILEALVESPNWVPREYLDDSVGYKRSSRDTYLNRLSARRLVETRRGEVRASERLF